MKKIIPLLLTFFILTGSPAQDTLKLLNTDTITNQLKQIDSMLIKQAEESMQIDTELNNRNLNAMVAVMKERDRKQKQQMYIRLGLGLLFLIVLIIGLMRRRKKKTV